MESSIVIDNLLVRYYSYLSKGSKSTLLLHGWRSDGLIWNDIAMRLNKDGYSVYAIDLPGFGGSSIPKKAFTVSDYADIVSRFSEKVGIKNFVLVGHSFGGRIAIKLATKESKPVQKLVLVDSAGFVNGKKQKHLFYVKLVRPLFRPKFMQGIRTRIYQKMGAEDYVATPYLRETFLRVVKEDLSEDLSRIYIPTLLLWGEHDKETPVSFGRKMNTLIQNSRLIILPSAGHFSFLDKPEEFYEALTHFIK